MLTQEELQLVERKDSNFRHTFSTKSFDEAEMAASESHSKFVNVFCDRKTFSLENSMKRKVPSSHYPQ